MEAKDLELDKMGDWGRWGSAPLSKPWVTLKVEGKPMKFLVDMGTIFPPKTTSGAIILKTGLEAMGTGPY
jgi:hypothetical protein